MVLSDSDGQEEAKNGVSIDTDQSDMDSSAGAGSPPKKLRKTADHGHSPQKMKAGHKPSNSKATVNKAKDKKEKESDKNSKHRAPQKEKEHANLTNEKEVSSSQTCGKDSNGDSGQNVYYVLLHGLDLGMQFGEISWNLAKPGSPIRVGDISVVEYEGKPFYMVRADSEKTYQRLLSKRVLCRRLIVVKPCDPKDVKVLTDQHPDLQVGWRRTTRSISSDMRNCFCGKRDSVPMVVCHICHRSFHFECVRLIEPPSPSWRCKKCSAKSPKKKVRAPSSSDEASDESEVEVPQKKKCKTTAQGKLTKVHQSCDAPSQSKSTDSSCKKDKAGKGKAKEEASKKQQSRPKEQKHKPKKGKGQRTVVCEGHDETLTHADNNNPVASTEDQPQEDHGNACSAAEEEESIVGKQGEEPGATHIEDQLPQQEQACVGKEEEERTDHKLLSSSTSVVERTLQSAQTNMVQCEKPPVADDGNDYLDLSDSSSSSSSSSSLTSTSSAHECHTGMDPAVGLVLKLAKSVQSMQDGYLDGLTKEIPKACQSATPALLSILGKYGWDGAAFRSLDVSLTTTLSRELEHLARALELCPLVRREGAPMPTKLLGESPDPPVLDASSSASAWNQHVGLPSRSLPIGWNAVPPLCNVSSFILVQQVHFDNTSHISDPILLALTTEQCALLEAPGACLWLGQYHTGRIQRWNTFIHIEVGVGGQFSAVPFVSYTPKRITGKDYYGPLFVNLVPRNKTRCSYWPFTPQTSIRFQKDVEGYTRLLAPHYKHKKLPPLGCDTIILAIGKLMDPATFLHQRLPSMAISLHSPPSLKGDDGDLEDMVATCKLSLQDVMTAERLVHPVRGVNCSHLQCIDLGSLLRVSLECVTTFDWMCPICKTYMPGLCYDVEVLEVLNKFPDEREVLVDLDQWGRRGYLPRSAVQRPQDIVVL